MKSEKGRKNVKQRKKGETEKRGRERCKETTEERRRQDRIMEKHGVRETRGEKRGKELK